MLKVAQLFGGRIRVCFQSPTSESPYVSPDLLNERIVNYSPFTCAPQKSILAPAKVPFSKKRVSAKEELGVAPKCLWVEIILF